MTFRSFSILKTQLGPFQTSMFPNSQEDIIFVHYLPKMQTFTIVFFSLLLYFYPVIFHLYHNSSKKARVLWYTHIYHNIVYAHYFETYNVTNTNVYITMVHAIC